MEKTETDTLTIAITTMLKTLNADISDYVSSYLLIVKVRKNIQLMRYINSKGEEEGGPYVEYYSVKGFKINQENNRNKTKDSIIEIIMNNKIDVLLTNDINPFSLKRLNENNIPVYKAAGNVREAIAKLLKNELREIK